MSDNAVIQNQRPEKLSMRQKSLAEEGFEKFRKTTRREQFLQEMD